MIPTTFSYLKCTPTPSFQPCLGKLWKTFLFRKERGDWSRLPSKHRREGFSTKATNNVFPRLCCNTHKKHENGEPGLFKEELRCSVILCRCGKTYCCHGRWSNKYKFSSNGQKTELWRFVVIDQRQNIAEILKKLSKSL